MDRIYFTRKLVGSAAGYGGFAWTEAAGTVVPAIGLIWPHTPKREARGLLIERAHANYLRKCSNFAGVASIAPGSLNGTGVNGSAIADDTVDTVADTLASAFNRSFKFTAGNPMAADLYVRFPDTGSIANDEPLHLTCLVKNDVSGTSADEVVIRLFRVGDSQYWNDATPGFQAGAVWNSTGLAAAGVYQRWFSKPIDLYSGATTFRVDVGIKSGGTASRTAHVYYVGLDKNQIGCHSVIPADSADTACGIDEMRYDCPAGDPFSTARGTILMRATLGFNMSEAGNIAPGFFKLVSGGGAFHCQYNLGTNSLVFTYGGAAASLAFGGGGQPAVPVRYTQMRIGCRWTSALAELGYNQRADLFYSSDGVTWYQANVTITTLSDGAAQAWYLGGDGPQRSSMWFRHEVLPICLSDEEIKARLA